MNTRLRNSMSAIIARYERLPLSPFGDLRQGASRQSQQREAERQVEGLFQSLLALSFTEGLAESFGFKAQRTLQS